MLLETRIESPIRLRKNYDATIKYNVGDVVRFVISGVSKGWLLMVDAPIGTAPRANSAYWVEFTAALAESRGAQGLPAPTPQARYSADGTTFRANYVDGDLFREVSFDDGATWTRERIRGDKGDKGNPGVAKDGKDGTNAPLVIWQYAADPPDDVTPIEWRDNYVAGDVWKHWSNDNGTTWGPPERILGRDGRDGFDLERQYSDSHDGPWEARDTGQEWVRERIGNVDPFGVPYRRSGDTHAVSGITESRARQIATEIANARAEARYTDTEKSKLGGVEPNATADQSPEEIRDALRSLGITFEKEIIDMLNGLRDATVDDFGKLGIGPDGILYRVKRKANPGHDAEGMFNAYMHAQYRGVAHGRPSNPQAGEIYYNIRIHQWYLFFENRVVVQIDAQPITPVQALGANTEWIGEVDDNYQAVHAIQNFDNTKAYYAIYGETLYVLDNSSYSAATTETTYTYEWVPVIPDTPADEDKVDKSDLNPIVTVYPNEKRKSELLDIYTVQIYNLAASLPNVDQIRITFADEQVINTRQDVTSQEWNFAINEALAAKIEAATPIGRGHWVVRVEYYENGEVIRSVGVPVHFLLIPPDSIAIEQNKRDIDTLQDKTADMFVHREPGDFANNVDPRVTGVAIVVKSQANQNALNSGSFDFNTVTFAQTTVGVPDDDTNVYDLVVRTAKSLGRVEGEFRVYERSAGTNFAFPLKQLIQEDDNWYYYFTVDARAGDSWFVQYRGTHPHNTYNGELGQHPLEQIDRHVEGGLLGKKTTDLKIIEEAGVFADLLDQKIASITSVERTTENDTAITDNNFDWDGQTWTLPTITHTSDGNRYYLVVRIPKALGDIANQFRILTTDPTKAILKTIGVAEANDATYNYYLADTNTDSITWTLQRQGQRTRTRYDGEVPGTGGVTPTPTPGGSGVLEYESIPNDTTIQARQIVVYRNGYYGAIVTHTKQSGGNPASDTTNWRYLSSVLGNWVAGNYPAGTIAKEGGEQWIANEVILTADPAPTNENNTKWKRLTSHEGLTALITRVDDAFDDINTNRVKIAEDETKLENFIQAVNNYFNGQGEGDVTAQQIAHLFALLDEYNPVVDEIRSTLGLVSETQPAQRLIQEYEDQATLISNADVPTELPAFQHKFRGLIDDRNYLLYIDGLQGSFRIRADSSSYPNVGSASEDPHIQYYLNGDTDQEDAHILNVIAFVRNELFICMQTNVDGGTDPLAFLTGAKLRPYASYTPITDIPANGTIAYGTAMNLAPTNADHDATFVGDFDVESPSRQIRINSAVCRGWHFNDFESDTPVTLCKILAQWYVDARWILEIYKNYRVLVTLADTGRPGAVDPREREWYDTARDPNNAALAVERPPYPSLDALKSAIPLPTLKMYFKASVSNFVMNIANHDIHNPVVNKLVQIPDTHYDTPPRVTFLPMVARENELFHLESDQYRPDSDHTWTFDPVKHTVYNRDLIGASLPTVIGSTPYPGFGRTSASVGNLPDIFKGASIGALVVFNDDPEHIHLYINSARVATSDIVVIEMHGMRSDGSPIVRTASFTHTGTRDQWRHFQSRVSGAYNIFDFSESLSISIKRGNTYLYLNDANSPPTPEWRTGLLYTAGLYKGKADGTFAKAVILEETALNMIVSRFGGKELLEKTGSYPYRVIANANAALTDAIATNDTRFSDTGLFLNQQNNADDKHLSQFDRLVFEVYLLNGSNVAVASTSFSLSLTQLSAIVAQGTANVSAGNQVDATVEDGRAVIHNWRTKDKPATPAEDTSGQARNLARAIQTNLLAWINDFRAVDHTIYIGRTGETNSRLLIAVKSHKLGIGLQVRGYF